MGWSNGNEQRAPDCVDLAVALPCRPHALIVTGLWQCMVCQGLKPDYLHFQLLRSEYGWNPK